jgi:hypothetical protein
MTRAYSGCRAPAEVAGAVPAGAVGPPEAARRTARLLLPAVL